MFNDIPTITVRDRTWHYLSEQKPFCSMSGCSEKATRKAYVLALLGQEDGFWLNAYLCEGCYKAKMREEEKDGRIQEG